MKKTQIKNLLRSVRKAGVSFFAVAFIAAVSISIYCGLMFSAEAELRSANRYFDANRLANFETACANGITQDDIAALTESGTVTEAEGGYTAIAVMEGEEENVILQVRSMCQKLNQPVVIEGALPQARNEVAVEQLMADKQGVTVGDTITLRHDGMLYETEFHVTGIINEPSFSSTRAPDARGRTEQGIGAASYFVDVPLDAFDPDYYSGCYTVAYMRDSSLDGIFYFSDQYESAEQTVEDRLEAFGAERAALRYDELKSEADEKLSDAQKKIDDADRELADGKKELAEKEQELDDGKQELAESEQELDEAEDAIQSNLTALGLTGSIQEVYDALEGTGNPLLPTLRAYLDGREAAEEARAEIADGEQAIADAKKEISDGEAELADAKAEFADAQEEVDDLAEKEWIVSPRNDMGDVRSIERTVEGMRGLSYSMAFIFLIVAAIICYSSVTRLIDEQRSLIGAQKALGFSSGEILRHYICYNTLCALLGIFIGLTTAVGITEMVVVYSAYADVFLFPEYRLAFVWKDALIAIVLCLLIFIAATYAACSKQVKTPATQLLRGEIPVAGKKRFFEKWKVYQRLSLYSKAMIKNVLQDKGRAAVTIMGVVGCTALLVICFSMNMSSDESTARQCERYYHFTHRLVVDTETGDVEQFRDLLEREGVPYALTQEKVKLFRVNGGSYSTVHVMSATDEASLHEMVRIEDIETKEEIAIPAEGVLISRRSAELNDLTAGDTIEIMDNEGTARPLTVAGVIEHYQGAHLFYVNPSYYESCMGEAIDECVFLVQNPPEGLADSARQMDGFLSLKDLSGDFYSTGNQIVVLVLLTLSAVMAVLVLLNQGIMYINHKARELAVMRINGFTLGQTKAYVYKDNIVLTAVGLLIGCGVGAGVSYIIIRFLEVDAQRYARDPNISACLIACGLGAVFAIIINLIALRRVNHLNLTNVSSN